MGREACYVSHLYKTYPGRIPISVAYDENCIELFPFVFEAGKGNAIGIVALAVATEEKKKRVHIYHISSFHQRIGCGSLILQEICHQADRFQIILTLSPVSMGNGKGHQITYHKLKMWYEKFGFLGNAQLRRLPELQA